MGFAQPLAFWIALILPAILFFHILKIRRRDQPVSSTLLWKQALLDAQAARPWQRLRSSLLLLLQILLAAAMVLALARPYLPAAGKGAETLVVMLDTSASMRAADENPSRFAAAKARIGELIDGLGARDRMALIAFAREATILAAPTGDRARLHRFLDGAAVTTEPARIDEALSLAFSLAEETEGSTVVIVSDGNFPAPSVAPPAGVRVQNLTVGRSGENLGITLFRLTPRAEWVSAAPPAGEGGAALVRVTNFGFNPRETTVRLTADGRVVESRPIRIAAGAEAPVIFTGLPAGARTFTATLDPGDIYAPDDRAWAVAPGAGDARVLLVSHGNPFLERALLLDPGLEVYRLEPEDYLTLPEDETYDLYIFDGPLPGIWPRGNVLVVGPEPGPAPLEVGGFLPGGPMMPVETDHPLMRFVSWDEVAVARFRQILLPPDWRAVLGTPEAPLLAAGEDNGRRIAVLAFSLQESDLILRPAFPILIRNLRDWLIPAGLSVPEQTTVGEPIAPTPSPLAETVEVETPDGERIRIAPPFPPLAYSPPEPGLYALVEGLGEAERRQPFAVNAPAAESNLAPRADGEPAGEPEGNPASAWLTNAEIWPWLGWAALALLLAEWGVYSRGR